MELYLRTREEWRSWLERNYSISEGVWLVYYKKPSGKPTIHYPDSVEEALCYGWIDGKIKRINDDYYIRSFTPRRPGSRWSRYNIERVERLIKKGLMKPAGIKAYKKALDSPELIYDNRADGETAIPDDLLTFLKDSEPGFRNFMNFSPSSRRIYIEWLNNAKRVETRLKRLNKIVILSEKNIRPGII